MTPVLNKIAVIGAGLIGGSFALAVQRAGLARSVIACDRNETNLQIVIEKGIAHEATTSAAHAVAGADLVLIAIPVGQMEKLLHDILPHLASHAVVTDVGSTKCNVVTAAHKALGDRIGCFVAGHPIAGSECHGPSAARADLFDERNVILTPTADTDSTAASLVASLWRACGAHVQTLGAEQHDAIFAAVSHLPHLLAFALVDELGSRDNADQMFGFAGSGFRDFTRIAASSPEMWRDVSLANRDALMSELDLYMARLDTLRSALDRHDGAALEQGFRHAQQHRAMWQMGRPPSIDSSSTDFLS